LLQSIRPRHDGAGIILRYWDALGLPRQVEVELKGPVSKVWRCDLMERPTEELPVSPTGSGVRVPVKIAAHAIETLLVEF
jgi:alpha-mannosidase